MKTFNSKEAKVRAIQLWPDTVEQVQEALGMDNKYIGNDKTVMVICDTKTGRIVIHTGQWLVIESNGEMEVLTDKDFKAKYE